MSLNGVTYPMTIYIAKPNLLGVDAWYHVPTHDIMRLVVNISERMVRHIRNLMRVFPSIYVVELVATPFWRIWLAVSCSWKSCSNELVELLQKPATSIALGKIQMSYQQFYRLHVSNFLWMVNFVVVLQECKIDSISRTYAKDILIL